MQCSYFDAHLCRSCSQMGVPYASQLAGKDAEARELLAGYTSVRWLDPVASPESAFRNKAKMVVGGSVQSPTLGIVSRDGLGIDLVGCGLYDVRLSATFPVLRALIQRASLTPYNIVTRRGELKNILVTLAPDGELMVRFVLRSKKLMVPIRREIPWLQEQLPQLRVVSVNLLRDPVALVEGEEEIILSGDHTLPMRLTVGAEGSRGGDLLLYLRPQSFFQTNTQIAEALYSRAQHWIRQVQPVSLWDLYCGVGGFALAAAQVLGDQAQIWGVELSEEAIVSASCSANELGLSNMNLVAGDATEFALNAAVRSDVVSQLLVVNPPRRGIGKELARWVEQSGIEHVVYSSCNARSLAKDLAILRSYEPVEAQVLDMFPQSTHYEVITLLRRRADPAEA